MLNLISTDPNNTESQRTQTGSDPLTSSGAGKKKTFLVVSVKLHGDVIERHFHKNLWTWAWVIFPAPSRIALS